MKKAILSILLIMPFFCFCQTDEDINGVLGIPFGASRDKVIEVLASKGAISKQKEGKILFSNVKFGPYEGCLAIFSFVGNKFYEVIISLPHGPDGTVINRYDRVNRELSKEYGETKTYKKFQYPYKEGDGRTLSALKGGKAEFEAYWTKEIGSVSSKIMATLDIFLTYQDNKLTRKALEENYSKKKAVIN
ncbi:hypothetical protein [Pedobacter rhodius]|uniref:DUF4468 domain-containing protein n=1 Tax=Pedobacter rhodius TaxID=3004098 RepID=A0ABT4L1X6_9SPHI|nr:hypothetical protein [Pedobacter sp. SJ11]MCZ4224941.1 hypothetical protein [Pedobacter sp. SJ11]